MIKSESLTSIGTFFKPHGIKGELSATFDFDIEPSELRCLILDIDGIYVPFFIDSVRRRGASSWLIKLDGIDSEKSAAAYSNHEIFVLTDELPSEISEDSDDGVYLYDLIGYEIVDGVRVVGEIEGVDDSTANILFIVKASSGETVYVPFAEEFIDEIDKENNTIIMNLPQGLVDLNS